MTPTDKKYLKHSLWEIIAKIFSKTFGKFGITL